MVSIVVCTHNREKYLGRCLEHLAMQDADWSLFEVILVNNNSTDSTPNIVEQFVKSHIGFPLKYFFESKPGLSNARNTGIKQSSGNVITFIDDDAFVARDYVSNITEFFEQNTDVDGFGGIIKPFMECETPVWMSSWLMPLMSVLDMGSSVKQFKRKAYPIGANMGFTRRAAQRVGIFNTRLGRTGLNLMGGEEKDYFFRMREAGMKIFYLPNVLVHHVVPSSRLTIDFVKKQAKGIGASEKLRTKSKGNGAYILAISSELFKWLGSIALAAYYSLRLEFPKAKMLLKFRYWVSTGFFKNVQLIEPKDEP